MSTSPQQVDYWDDGNTGPAYSAQRQNPNSSQSFLNSPGGAALIHAAGGAASAYGANQSANAGRQQSANQFAAQMYDRLSNEDRVNAQNAMTPLGESQNFAAGNRVKASLAGQMGNLTGLGGRPSLIQFDPSMIQKNWGDGATMESLAQHAKQLSAINPNAPKENFNNYGFDPSLTQGFQNNIDTYQGNQLQSQNNQRALIQRALDNDVNGDKQLGSNDPGSGFWHKLVKYVAPIAGIALAPYTGGASLALGSAASAWANGGGAKDALIAGGSAAAGNAVNTYAKSRKNG